MTTKPAYPTKAIREACWRERDNLWKCLDDHNDDESQCKEIRKAVIASCPEQWVSHYDRRRKYLQFKDKIEKGGYDPVEEYTKANQNRQEKE